MQDMTQNEENATTNEVIMSENSGKEKETAQESNENTLSDKEKEQREFREACFEYFAGLEEEYLAVHSSENFELLKDSVVLSRENPGHYDLAVDARATQMGVSPSRYRGMVVAAAKSVKQKIEERDEERHREARKARLSRALFFERGDHAELSQVLLSVLSSKTESLVYDQGAVWSYGQDGVYHEVREGELSAYVLNWAGSFVGEVDVDNIDKANVLCISENDRKGVISMACARLDGVGEEDYFDNAPPGIMFAGNFVHVVGDRVVVEKGKPEHRARFSLPFAYDPCAPRERWERFLDEVFQGEADKEEKKLSLQQFAGAALMGVATKYAKSFILTGEGKNGKSVFVNTISGLFDKKTLSNVSPQEFMDDNKVMALAQAKLNAASEISAKFMSESARFKAVISGDRVGGREVYKKASTFCPRAGHIFSANTLPRVADISAGFWRRVAVVEFGRKFEKHEVELELTKYLIEHELQGIAAWAVEGARSLLVAGEYTLSSSSIEASYNWMLDSDPIAQFVEERCIDINNGTTWTVSKDLYAAFSEWFFDATGSNKSMPTIQSFGRSMGSLVKRRRTKQGQSYNCCVKGRMDITCMADIAM